MRWSFDENDVPALDYLPRRRVVNMVGLEFLTVTTETALPGFVAKLFGVGLDVDLSPCAGYLGEAQVRLFALDFRVRGFHAKN